MHSRFRPKFRNLGLTTFPYSFSCDSFEFLGWNWRGNNDAWIRTWDSRLKKNELTAVLCFARRCGSRAVTKITPVRLNTCLRFESEPDNHGQKFWKGCQSTQMSHSKLSKLVSYKKWSFENALKRSILFHCWRQTCNCVSIRINLTGIKWPFLSSYWSKNSSSKVLLLQGGINCMETIRSGRFKKTPLKQFFNMDGFQFLKFYFYPFDVFAMVGIFIACRLKWYFHAHQQCSLVKLTCFGSLEGEHNTNTHPSGVCLYLWKV